MPFIKPTFLNCYFKILVEPHYKGNDDQFAKYCQTPRNHRFQEVFCRWSSERRFGALTAKFAPNSIVAQNMANLQNTVTGLLFTVFCWSICAHHVSNILQVTTHKMASLENIVTRLRIVVLCYSSSAYHQNDTLELLPWNCLWTPLWRKRWPICIILSHASKSSFSFSYLVLIVWATLLVWNSRWTAQKMTKLQNTVRRLVEIVLSLSCGTYKHSVTFRLLG